MKKTSVADLDLSDPNNPKVVHLNRGLVKQFLQDFGKSVRITVTYETYRRKRTVEQNSTLHWYIDEIAQETGMDFMNVKEQMAKKFLTVEVLDKDDNVVADPETGEVMTRVRSTTELNTIEFNEYTEKIRLWCNEFLHFELPLPDTQKSIKFK